MLKFLWNHKGKVALALLAVAIFATLMIVCWKVPSALPAIKSFKAFGIHPFGFLGGFSALSASAIFAGISTAATALVGAIGFGLWKAAGWCLGKFCTSKETTREQRQARFDAEGESAERGHHHSQRHTSRRDRGQDADRSAQSGYNSRGQRNPDLPSRGDSRRQADFHQSPLNPAQRPDAAQSAASTSVPSLSFGGGNG